MSTRKSCKPKALAILGAGAIGQLLCHQLHARGMPVYLIGRNYCADRVQLTLEDLQQNSRTIEVPWLQISSESEALSSVRLLLVCVKSYQVKQALSSLWSRLHSDCHIVLLNNGIGPHLEILPYLGGRRLILGTTAQAGMRLGRFDVRQTGSGVTRLGTFSPFEMQASLKEQLLVGIDGTNWCENIMPALWAKLAVNAGINALTALNDCPNGALSQPNYRSQLAAIIEELVMVARLDGISFEYKTLLEQVYEVISLTANNYSSMHQDIKLQRATEIEAINGYICQRAASHQVATPANHALAQAIRQLENAQ